MKRTVVEVLKQMIPVIVGILVALFINSWNEQRKDQNYIDEISKSIVTELEESRIDIVENIPKQNRLMDSLRFYAKDESLSLLDIVLKTEGFHSPQIRINSWEAISRTKIELVPYEQLKALSNIENSKELLEDKEKYLMTFVYSNMRENSSDIKETIIFLLLDIISTEMSIKENIENFKM
ncbi:MAG: hypothetical protein AAFQ94_07995 [Bacteroidota bacterium]